MHSEGGVFSKIRNLNHRVYSARLLLVSHTLYMFDDWDYVRAVLSPVVVLGILLGDRESTESSTVPARIGVCFYRIIT